MPLSRALANVVLTTAPLMVLAALGWPQIARADAVLDWNAIAVKAISTATPPRPVSSHTTIDAREKFLADVKNPTIQSPYCGVSPIASSTEQSDNGKAISV
jgi:hypothetical protein